MAGERPASIPDTSVPSVEQTGNLGGGFTQRASPEAFGSQVGGALTDVGEQAFQQAQHYQDIYNDSRARDIVTQGSLKLGDLEMQYRQNRGNNAVGALQEFQNQTLALQNQMVAAAGNPAAQIKVKNDFAREVDGSLRSAGQWAGQQMESAKLTSYDSQIAAKVNLAAMHAGEPDRFNNDLSDIATLATEKSAYMGHDNATADQIMSHYIGEATYAGVRSLNNSDPAAAQALYERMRGGGLTAFRDGKQVVIPYLDAEYRARIETMMAASSQERLASQYTDQFPNMTAEEIQNTVQGLKPKQVPAEGDQLDIRSGINYNEWHGKGQAPISIDGAVGNHQILPDTFAMYAKPGEKIDNPKDNDAVYERIISDYQQRYKGDPSRIAVAYFSGTGNVAPVGSPTPWLKDTQDSTGTKVSDYVQGALQHMGKGSGATSVANSQQNWLHDTVQDAAVKFLKKVNEDPKGTWEQIHGSQPINIGDAKSVATGVQTALAISGQYNVPVQNAVWSKNDAARLVSQWDTMPLYSDPKEGGLSKSEMLLSVRQGAGVYAPEVLAPLKKVSPNIVYAAGMDDPKVAMQILQGDERIVEDKDKVLPLSKVDAAMQSEGYDTALLPQQYDQVKSAARSIFAARYSSGQNIKDDDIKGVIKDALGGMEKIDYSGKSIMTPPKVAANQMQTFLKGLDNNDILAGMQNAQVMLTNGMGPYQMELPRGKDGATFQTGQTQFSLQSVSPGLYLAMQPNGEPYAAPGMKGGKMFLKFTPDQIAGRNQQVAQSTPGIAAGGLF